MVQTPLELPAALVDAVREGNAILFLGSGASIGAKHPNPQRSAPKGDDLKILLSDKFLGGRLKDRSLAAVAQFCVSEAGLLQLQAYLKELLLDFSPADFHLLIPEFHWHAVATTNYDLIIDRAYQSTEKPLQTLVPFIKNDQLVEREAKKVENPLKFLKLHGCLNHSNDAEAPLIITSDQYVTFAQHRSRLFDMLRGMAHEFPLIFCGYSIDDPNIRTVLFDLFNANERRPQYYVVSPKFEDIEARLWQSNRITPIKATFETFLRELDRQIPANSRRLSSFRQSGAPSIDRFRVLADRTYGEATVQYLATDILHVRAGMPIEQVEPVDYYKGYDRGFAGVLAKLDVRRKVSDTVLVDAVLEEETASRKPVELFVLKGAAGNGKTTALKRTAWDAATDYDALVFYLSDMGALRADRFQEIHELTNRRIFLIVDRPSLRASELSLFLRQMQTRKVQLSVITAERDNEWNTRCEALEEFVVNSYPVRYLTDLEIGELLEKLGTHRALGLLAEMKPDDRVRAFKDRAQRQILVALHEATLGRPFEEIVVDEYARITPEAAKLLYLDICTLNRFGVPVRAGLIARVSGIHFEEFEKELFQPLEKIVYSEYDRYIGDRVYRARHPHVAEIVFSETLSNHEDKLNQILRILGGLNISFSVDKEAFDQMTRGRVVADTFPSVEMGRSLYRVAQQAVGQDDPYILQQEAIFEINHGGGNLPRAEKLLGKAEEIAGHDASIQHSIAVLYRKKALDESNPLLRAEYRRRSLSRLRSGSRRHAYEVNTRLLVLIDELKDMLREEQGASGRDRVLLERMKEVESELSTGQRLFPNDEYILTTEANYRTAISDNPNAKIALEKAFRANPRQEWIAVRLANLYLEGDDVASAKTILQKVITEHPTAKTAHFQLGVLQARSSDVAERRSAIQHFRSGFSNGDNNYDAQLWYGRELFLAGDYAGSDSIFDSLQDAPISPSAKRTPNACLTDPGGAPTVFKGQVVKQEVGYVFIASHQHGRDIFAHEYNSSRDHWEAIQLYDEVNFNIAFTFRGPMAMNVISIQSDSR